MKIEKYRKYISVITIACLVFIIYIVIKKQTSPLYAIQQYYESIYKQNNIASEIDKSTLSELDKYKNCDNILVHVKFNYQDEINDILKEQNIDKSIEFDSWYSSVDELNGYLDKMWKDSFVQIEGLYGRKLDLMSEGELVEKYSTDSWSVLRDYVLPEYSHIVKTTDYCIKGDENLDKINEKEGFVAVLKVENKVELEEDLGTYEQEIVKNEQLEQDNYEVVVMRYKVENKELIAFRDIFTLKKKEKGIVRGWEVINFNSSNFKFDVEDPESESEIQQRLRLIYIDLIN